MFEYYIEYLIKKLTLSID